MLRTETPADAERQSCERTPSDAAAAIDKLQEMPLDGLRREWQRLYRSKPDRRVSRDLLVLAVAWKYQELASGTRATPTIRRLKKLADSIDADGGRVESRKTQLRPGARLLREWGGVTHTITVADDGFEWEGRRYGSLSEIARAITGTRWSGPRFFGLKQGRAAEVTRRDADE